MSRKRLERARHARAAHPSHACDSTAPDTLHPFPTSGARCAVEHTHLMRVLINKVVCTTRAYARRCGSGIEQYTRCGALQAGGPAAALAPCWARNARIVSHEVAISARACKLGRRTWAARGLRRTRRADRIASGCARAYHKIIGHTCRARHALRRKGSHGIFVRTRFTLIAIAFTEAFAT